MERMERKECALAQVRNLLGDETVLSELNNYFSSDQMADFLESLNKDYELDLPCFRAEN